MSENLWVLLITTLVTFFGLQLFNWFKRRSLRGSYSPRRNLRIIFSRKDGGLNIVLVAPGWGAEDMLAQGLVPDGARYFIVYSNEVPADLNHLEDWTYEWALAGVRQHRTVREYRWYSEKLQDAGEMK